MNLMYLHKLVQIVQTHTAIHMARVQSGWIVPVQQIIYLFALLTINN